MADSVFEFDTSTTIEQAAEFREVQKQDYLRIGIPISEAQLMSFDADVTGSENMIDAIDSGECRYFGLNNGDSLTAVACLADWLYHDAAPYRPEIVTNISKVHAKVNAKIGRKVVHNSSLPVFGVADPERYQEEAGALLERMKEEANKKGSRLLFASPDIHDEAFIEAFKEKGAKLVRRKIEPIDVHGVERLYGLMKVIVR